MPVRSGRQARGGADRAARIHRRGVARLSAGSAAGPALRLPGPTAPTSRRTAIASTRTSCCSIPMPRRFRATSAGAMSCTAIGSAARARTSPSTGATARAICRSAGWSRPPSPGATTASRRLPWERRSSSSCTSRGITMRHPEVPEAHRGTFAGARPAGGDRLPASSSASPPSSCCRSRLRPTTATWSSAASSNYWGYNTIGFFAPDPRFLPSRRDRRVQDRGQAAARRRHRGDPRRRLQPHRRGQPSRPDPVVPRHRQRRPTTGCSDDRALLLRRHRHRQHAEPRPPARAAAGHGFAALLGARDACRRLPLRSVHDTRRARTATISQSERLLRRDPAGPGDWRS